MNLWKAIWNPKWSDVTAYTAMSIIFTLVGLLTRTPFLNFGGVFLLLYAALKAFYVLRPPNRSMSLRQYAKDVFDGKIDPDKE